MKKNMISVLILALLVINTAMTALMMITVFPQAQKTNELIGKIAGAIDLELSSGQIKTSATIPIEDIETYAIADTMTINLKPDGSEGGDKHVAMVSVVLSLNTKDGDYADKQPMLAANEGLVRNVINRVISSHTLPEIRDDQQAVQTEILKELQSTFDSDFIVDVGFSNISYQ
jgi:flagellar FliL protein